VASKKKSHRDKLNEMLRKAASERVVREQARAAELAEKGKELWPMLLGTEREAQIGEFFGRWTPDSVIERWRVELAAYGINASTAVQRIPVSLKGRSKHLGGHPPSGAAWWPKCKLVRLRSFVLQWLEENPDLLFVPDAVMRPGMVSESSGLATTVASLAEVAEDPQRVGAVLISASLFPRVVNSRRYLDWKLERWFGLLLYNWMLKVVHTRWHYACSDALPLQHDGFGGEIEDMERLIGVLAHEHARVLHTYVPVCVKFVDEQPLPTMRLVE
jgi:hypothetical protein